MVASLSERRWRGAEGPSQGDAFSCHSDNKKQMSQLNNSRAFTAVQYRAFHVALKMDPPSPALYLLYLLLPSAFLCEHPSIDLSRCWPRGLTDWPVFAVLFVGGAGGGV